MEIGRVCIKTKGRNAGRKVVVIGEVKEGKVLIDGEKVKRKECNVLHLFPTKEKLELKKDANHEEIIKSMGTKK
jgi:large subunit ribosomal protein L14e